MNITVDILEQMKADAIICNKLARENFDDTRVTGESDADSVHEALLEAGGWMDSPSIRDIAPWVPAASMSTVLSNLRKCKRVQIDKSRGRGHYRYKAVKE